MSNPPTVTVPSVGGIKPVIMRMRGGFSRAVRPEKTEHFPALDRKRNAIHGSFCPESFYQILNFNHSNCGITAAKEASRYSSQIQM